VAELDNDKNGKGVVDKPWLAVDRSSGRRGTLYVAWSRLDEERKRWELRCAALPPGGREFGASVQLGEPSGFELGPDHCHHVQLAVRPDGTLDAVWRTPPLERLVHASSSDGGKTFTRPAALSDDEKAGAGRFPSLTATPEGTLFVAWARSGGVYCSELVRGRWSAPGPVAAGSAKGVRLTHPEAAATAGARWVLAYRWLDERVLVTLNRSTDQRKSWEEYAVLASRTLPPRPARSLSPGDYVGLAAVKDVVYAAYVLPGEGREGPGRRLYVSAVEVAKPPR
jgi:hypothetical protein